MDKPNLTELESRLREAEEQLRAAKELREEEHAELMVYRQYAEGLAPTFAEHEAIVKALRVICASTRWGTVRSWYAAMGPEERKAYDVLERVAKRREES
jgi:phosphopantetheinyl transferase (holo-ACP synthase)